jgi:acyl-CoA reductase-like NAD-dependent aldehyde dehydrogenase
MMSVVQEGRLLLLDPRTGAEVGHIPVTPVADVASAVARARVAGAAWAMRPLAERKKVVAGLQDRLLARASDIAATLVAEVGRPAPEAWTSEVLTAQELFAHWLSVIDDELADVEVPLNPINYPGKKVTIELHPLGVIGLVMPWNYPFHLPLRTILPALLAGNAVVFKPSEHAPRTGALLDELFRASLPAGLVEVVQGAREVGEALVDAKPDKVIFTGSVATGRAVAVRAAQHLIPCALELGSKDPAIVLADADLDRAANGIVWGAFHNAGQDCASVERCYVVREVYDTFVQKVVAATRTLRAGADVGPLMNARQLQVVAEQVAEAVANGATALTGGAQGWWGDEPSPGPGFWFPPTVLTGVRDDHLVMREETFGPVLPIIPVRDAAEAIALANASRFALCASVWGRNLEAAAEVVAQVECGVAFVNNCCFTGPMGGATWGGRKESGYGVTGSRYGLQGLVHPRTVCIDRSRGPREMWWFPYRDALSTMARGVIEVSRSGGSKMAGARDALSGLVNRWK